MTAADRLILLAAHGVSVMLTDEGELDVSGDATLVELAAPAIWRHRDELLEELRSSSTFPHMAT